MQTPHGDGKFHSYSFGNILEIARQKPDATRVAGLYAWNQLGRRVSKGQKGSREFAACGRASLRMKATVQPLWSRQARQSPGVAEALAAFTKELGTLAAKTLAAQVGADGSVADCADSDVHRLHQPESPALERARALPLCTPVEPHWTVLSEGSRFTHQNSESAAQHRAAHREARQSIRSVAALLCHAYSVPVPLVSATPGRPAAADPAFSIAAHSQG